MSNHESNEPEMSPADHDLDTFMKMDLQHIPLPQNGLASVQSAVQSALEQSQTIHRPQFNRRRWIHVATAAAASLAGGAYFFKSRADKFDDGSGIANSEKFIQDSLAKARGTIMLDLRTPDWQALQTHLAANKAPISQRAESKLTHLTTRGCDIFDWKGAKAGLTCYLQKDGALVHIFTIEKAKLTDAGSLNASLAPVSAQQERQLTCWAEQNVFCVLVTGKSDTTLDESVSLLSA
jgi:hypothetical protein